MMVVSNPLMRPYFLGGGALERFPLDSHELPEFQCKVEWTDIADFLF